MTFGEKVKAEEQTWYEPRRVGNENRCNPANYRFL